MSLISNAFANFNFNVFVIIVCRLSNVFTVSVAKKSSLIATHVLPESDGGGWNLEADAKIIR